MGGWKGNDRCILYGRLSTYLRLHNNKKIRTSQQSLDITIALILGFKASGIYAVSSFFIHRSWDALGDIQETIPSYVKVAGLKGVPIAQNPKKVPVHLLGD